MHLLLEFSIYLFTVVSCVQDSSEEIANLQYYDRARSNTTSAEMLIAVTDE
ncbi:MAG: hypothetical protein HRT71_13280 [Flavobacteriales bacterium]|nr:hypothetical protein [Flavobacteriales bacterium]